MYMGRLDPALSIPMAVVAAAACGAAVWAWIAGGKVSARNRSSWRIAFWMMFPVTFVSTFAVVAMLVIFTHGHAHPLYQYSGNPDDPWSGWRVWAWCFLFVFCASPLVGALSLVSLWSGAREQQRALWTYRVLSLVSCVLAFIGTMANFPSR